MRLLLASALWIASLALPAIAAERWRMQYFYDVAEDTEFVITALTFAAPQHGIAAGYLDSGRKDKPYAVATANGGETWTPVTLPEPAVSLYFLNRKAGWLVGRANLWRTTDFGETWTKLGRAPGALRVWFVSEERGWAAGTKKSLYETSDGGATWKKVPAADEPKTTPENTIYGAIAFANPKVGAVSGWSKPPRHGESDEAPDWMSPEKAHREWPSVTIMLETGDGGATWKVSETSMFGQITEMSFAPDGHGLGLVEFFDKFDYPSEVYRIEPKTGKTARSFRRRDRAVTDVLVPAEGPAYLAGFEPPGSVFHSPIPGKLKILKSSDLEEWQEMEVDYRALARRAQLASDGAGGLWASTDTGMILKLTVE